MGSKQTVRSSTRAKQRSLVREVVRGSARILTLAAALGVCLVPLAGATAGGLSEGLWVPTGGDGCPAGLICVVWDFSGDAEDQFAGEILCCIPAEDVWTSDLGACASFRD